MVSQASHVICFVIIGQSQIKGQDTMLNILIGGSLSYDEHLQWRIVKKPRIAALQT
jgi:hypothetical protein